MAQLDDIVGAVMQKVKDLGIDNDTIIGFTTDNGAENFTWPDGGQTPFAGGKGTVFRVPHRCKRRPSRDETTRPSSLGPNSRDEPMAHSAQFLMRAASARR
jgi:arylsulfatase A-like enzyme